MTLFSSKLTIFVAHSKLRIADHTFEFLSAQMKRTSIDSPKMSDWELLSFYNQDVCGLSPEGKDISAEQMKVFKRAEIHDFQKSAPPSNTYTHGRQV